MRWRSWASILMMALLAGGMYRFTLAGGRETIHQVPTRAPTYRGAASCASTACHGATRPADDVRCAYTVWMDKDRHVHAYDVLLTERSRIIERNYRKVKNLRPEQDRLCLRCHSLDADAVLHGQSVAFADGIGCERCHGPAEKWLTQHYLSSWKQLSRRTKETLGFHDTKDLPTRARLCATCHIGSGDAQVDHDLYAAGHPRLNFELASYQATMPPHWDVRAAKERVPDLVEARLWAVGQLVSAETALELLAFRAERKEQPWPEFAEYDCYACHHALTAAGRSTRGDDKRVPGTLPWNDWYYVMPRSLAGSPLGNAELSRRLTELGKLMNEPLPDREQVTAQARSAAQQLGKQLTLLNQARPWSATTLRQWSETICQDRQALSGAWDTSTQAYLALAALHNSLFDLGEPGPLTRSQLRALARGLSFPRGLDSPNSRHRPRNDVP